ncbi:conserved hypothetical protein [Candida dubliniensis CD36]|uniref:Uncharacterized protein n=1 Tax=Candida dubliniensis (strain CD36 / ATCC MYA-646 / CBS 7987 / NCPF 3949 / NRRL Y-17841) TaxID=573826 RepID=B9WJM9_CANDC|nr:conserved hypothetical protein [Candida dubliniensis CD36]CAX40576.1 conserved hypothetical protein [Candida dubliniensis CD36]
MEGIPKKHGVDSAPLARIDSNVYENFPNLIQHSHSIVRLAASREFSTSSNDEFYEASPVLKEEEDVYFPTLLDETNYPFVAVAIQPHMREPLVDCALNLQEIVTTKVHAFPFGNDTTTTDELALTRIFEFEMGDNQQKPSWWSPQNPWSEYINHTPNVPAEFTQEDVYLDQVFRDIYLS